MAMIFENDTACFQVRKIRVRLSGTSKRSFALLIENYQKVKEMGVIHNHEYRYFSFDFLCRFRSIDSLCHKYKYTTKVFLSFFRFCYNFYTYRFREINQWSEYWNPNRWINSLKFQIKFNFKYVGFSVFRYHSNCYHYGNLASFSVSGPIYIHILRCVKSSFFYFQNWCIIIMTKSSNFTQTFGIEIPI